MTAMATRAAAGAERAVGSSASGTNVQEPDVDEADVAKTDGRLVVPPHRPGPRRDGRQRQRSRASCPGCGCRADPRPAPSCCCTTGTRWWWAPRASRSPGGPIFDRQGIEPGGATRLLPQPFHRDERLRLLGVDLTDPAAPA